jgi:tRNA-dihydrouridine synthase A
VHLQSVDSVMLGRAAYHQPYLLSEVDNKIYHKTLDAPSREQVLLDFIEYIKQQNEVRFDFLLDLILLTKLF